MLFREIMAVCFEIHTKHINTLCGQNVGFVNIKLVVHIVTTAYNFTPVSAWEVVRKHRAIVTG